MREYNSTHACSNPFPHTHSQVEKMNNANDVTRPTALDRSEKAAGVSFIVIAVLVVFAMMHHPTPHSHSFEEFIFEVQSIDQLNRWVHGSSIVMLVGVFVGSTFFAHDLVTIAYRCEWLSPVFS
ncbi:MAG: hypothetical protein AAGG44_11625 [Planctomycetota bacterium]